MKRIAVFLLLSVFLRHDEIGVEGARILCLFPFPSVSHSGVFNPFAIELARRGHDLVVFTADPVTDDVPPSYRQIDVSFLNELKKTIRLPPVGTIDTFRSLDGFLSFANDVVDAMYSHPEMSRLMGPNSNEHFDLVIIEWLMFGGLSAVARQISAPLIGISSMNVDLTMYDSVANPMAAAYLPHVDLGYTDDMSFFERFTNLYYKLRFLWRLDAHANDQDAIARKHLGSDIPHVRDIMRNVSLILSYTDPVIFYPRPTVPAVIEIAGIQLNAKRKPVKLPERMQSFLDEAENGFIYFSFGSTVPGSGMLDRTRKQFVQAFSELPYRVLWKWENETLLGKPDNVFVAKWLPQREILAHPNIRVFMYQGGLQSTEEAVAHAVPVVGIPLLADQMANVRRMEAAGVGKMIRSNLQTITKEEVKATLLEIITDKGYKERMTNFRDIRNDRPQEILDRAIWWTEYVIRHKGARHLRVRAVDMPWYQLLLLDIIAVVALIIISTCALLYALIKCILFKYIVTADSKVRNKVKTK